MFVVAVVGVAVAIFIIVTIVIVLPLSLRQFVLLSRKAPVSRGGETGRNHSIIYCAQKETHIF